MGRDADPAREGPGRLAPDADRPRDEGRHRLDGGGRRPRPFPAATHLVLRRKDLFPPRAPVRDHVPRGRRGPLPVRPPRRVRVPAHPRAVDDPPGGQDHRDDRDVRGDEPRGVAVQPRGHPERCGPGPLPAREPGARRPEAARDRRRGVRRPVRGPDGRPQGDREPPRGRAVRGVREVPLGRRRSRARPGTAPGHPTRDRRPDRLRGGGSPRGPSGVLRGLRHVRPAFRVPPRGVRDRRPGGDGEREARRRDGHPRGAGSERWAARGGRPWSGGFPSPSWSTTSRRSTGESPRGPRGRPRAPPAFPRCPTPPTSPRRTAFP